MKVARYVGGGEVQILDEPMPSCPPEGLLVKAQACGLCSGELMSWYMDKKIPHVLGHEVCGVVVESGDPRFPIGSQVFAHHHSPCMKCEYCARRQFVHCETWRKTKLDPGGMAEFFAVSATNLTDTFIVDGIRAIDAALIEPLACVKKSVRAVSPADSVSDSAVIGLGFMGLLHLFELGNSARGYDINPDRVAGALELGIRAELPDQAEPADVIFVCPGVQSAFDFAVRIAKPGGTIVMFAPLAPSEELSLPHDIYFRDLRLVHSYSCGPEDTEAAASTIKKGLIQAEQVVSHFIDIDRLPWAYKQMKAGTILKPMVIFD